MGVKPATEREVRATANFLEGDHSDAAELLVRLWDQNRDQAAYITQMQATMAIAKKQIRQDSLF